MLDGNPQIYLNEEDKFKSHEGTFPITGVKGRLSRLERKMASLLEQRQAAFSELADLLGKKPEELEQNLLKTSKQRQAYLTELKTDTPLDEATRAQIEQLIEEIDHVSQELEKAVELAWDRLADILFTRQLAYLDRFSDRYQVIKKSLLKPYRRVRPDSLRVTPDGNKLSFRLIESERPERPRTLSSVLDTWRHGLF